MQKWFKAQRRYTSREDRPLLFQEEGVEILQEACGEPSEWNTQRSTIDAFKASPMWQSWTKAGHDEAALRSFIARLKMKHQPKQNNGAASREPAIGITTQTKVGDFEADVVSILKKTRGEPSLWNTKKSTIDAIKASPMWQSWTGAGLDVDGNKLVNLINRLKIKHIKTIASQKKG